MTEHYLFLERVVKGWKLALIQYLNLTIREAPEGLKFFSVMPLLVAYSIRINTGSEVMSRGMCPNH